ncbi:hypothetical protein CAPTEDRAFT_158995 [Capitella teleta]|uniref:CENP-T/Histone H4 histone fold domain-containing protein n=1 Tax=Capitella teleta TaxID=283909 RepID=R7TMM6_CAPTE|nr:hypothetical protein CAPTEDRAFT_158995 [Capitella teleta]|eukprot:ELT94894.1 hypothetical protein CAPTEDRAFT_158995 [Capitella teleta]
MQQNYTVEYNETFRSLNSVDESHQVEAQITLPPEEKIQEEAEVLEEEEGAGEEEEGGAEEEGEVEEEEGGGGEEGGEREEEEGGEEEEEKGGEEEGADEENQSSHSQATDKSEVSHVRNAFTELMRNPQVHQTLNEEILERARKNARPHEEPTPTKKTPVLAKSAKKVASRKPRKSNGLSRAQTKSIVEHFSEIRVSKKAIDEIEKISEKFWKRMVEDLNAFAHHAGRKSIHDTDVQLLMTRQRFIKDKNGLHELVRKYLPLEHREQLIPIARSGNIVYPKK